MQANIKIMVTLDFIRKNRDLTDYTLANANYQEPFYSALQTYLPKAMINDQAWWEIQHTTSLLIKY